MLGSVVQHNCMFVVLVSAQASAKLWLAYLASAMAHDEQSLATIAANSAVASRSRVHELLGRNDVKVSCLCPTCYACACLRILSRVVLHVFIITKIIWRQV